MRTDDQSRVEKLETGIPGFELISNGGLPQYRTTLVTGTSGSAKTVFAAQFLAEGIIKNNESGVFVTFEESPGDIRRNMASLGWNISAWEEEGKWAFVDASPYLAEDTIVVGNYDLGALMSRIEYAINKVAANRVAMDSLGAIFSF
jgi:circadian clock protein KaiC